MGAGMAFAATAAVVYGVGSQAARRVVGRLAMTGALLLLPMAAGHAMGLLSCETVPLSAAAIAALDGGSAVAAPPGARLLAPVPVLASNPFFVCFAGR